MESASGEGLLDFLPRGTVADSFHLVTGNAGEHKLVYALLRAANQSPRYEDFLATLDEPTYEPTDRLLVKRGGQIVAHLQVLDRLAWFHGVRLPVGGLQDLAILPEYRDLGYDRLLVSAAEQQMHHRGAILAFAHTDRPELFRDAGWCEAVGQRATRANIHEILARLEVSPCATGRRGRGLHTRLWRHVELDALDSVYRHVHATAWGALDRAEPYWRWLVGRKVHNELIVAVHGRDDWSELESPAHIVGYAVTHGSCVLELATHPAYAKTAAHLLARACQDAIEQGHRELSLHLPIHDPLHELMLAAGGEWAGDGRGGVLMLKLLNAARWIESIYPAMLDRAKTSDLSRPLQWVFDTGARSYRLELTRRSGHLMRDVTQPDVRCSPEAFAALLTGNLDVPATHAAGQLEIADPGTAAQVAAIFPAIPFWQSQFDTLRS